MNKLIEKIQVRQVMGLLAACIGAMSISVRAELVTYVSLDSNTGLNRPTPQSGANNASITTAGAKFGGAAQLDGDGDFFQYVDGVDTSIISSVGRTVSVWAKRSVADRRSVLGLHGTSTRTVGSKWDIDLTASGGAEVGVHGAPGNVARALDSGSSSANQWHLIVTTLDGADQQVRDIKTYIDGSRRSNTYANGTVVVDSQTSRFLIGVSANHWLPPGTAQHYFSGMIDDVAIWNEALTSDEIKCLYDVGANGSLNYTARQFDRLKKLHDVGSGSVVIGAHSWTYATALSGSAGLSDSAQMLTLILNSTAGTGLTGFPVISEFTSGSDGWTLSHNGFAARWASSGGNPGGYVEYLNTPPVAPAPTFIRSPAKFLGDWSPLDGKGQLRYDHGVFEQTTVQGTFPHAVIISGSGGTATWTGDGPDAPNSGWTNVIVPIREDAWQVISGSWSSLLTNVTSLDIRYELYKTSGGVDHEGIDNVQITLDEDVPHCSPECESSLVIHDFSDPAAGTAGWRGEASDNGSVVGSEDIEWHQENGDGFIHWGEDQGDSATMFFVAPPAFLGDQRHAYGGRLGFNIRQRNTDQFYSPNVAVLIQSGNVRLRSGVGRYPGTGWESFEVTLIEGVGWTNADTGTAATRADLVQVLGALEKLTIRGEYSGQSVESTGLDYVRLIAPLPKLSATFVAGQLELSWPLACICFRLESADGLSGTWERVNVAETVQSNTVMVRIGLESSKKFFRLVRTSSE